MNRTFFLKIGYPIALATLGFGVTLALGVQGPAARLPIAIALFIGLLIPGRISGLLFGDLYRSLQALRQGEFAQSERYAQAAVESIRRNPGRKPLLWLTWSIYTVDVEAMALNNLGAARLMQGKTEQAVAPLEEALRLDPKYPLPHFNLAIAAECRGSQDEARRLSRQAVRLGFTGGGIDRVVRVGQSILASIEGR